MADRIQLARLRITPSWGVHPLPVTTLRLVQSGGEYYIEVCVQTGRSRKSSRVVVSSLEVKNWLERLRKATVPAFPVSPMVCDGEYVELQVEGEYSTLTIGWWTIAPEGAEGVAEFADWLHEAGLGCEEDQEGGNE